MRIVWILGAGASKHLDLPLLAEFPQFITHIKYHNLNDRNLQNDCDKTLQFLPKAKGDIEELLRRYPMGRSLGTTFRRCIQNAFHRRHKAVFTKRDIPLKYKAYSYMLCLVEAGDSIVTFNYDAGIELTIENANRKDKEHVKQPRIPPECLDYVKRIQYALTPVSLFRGQPRLKARLKFDLLKLHGSINWERRQGKLFAPDGKYEPDKPCLVFPDPSKPESQKPPFSILFKEAKRVVDSCDVVVIAGYSVPRSDSERHPFVSHLKSQLTSKQLVVVDPYPSATILELVKNTHYSTLIALKFEDVFSLNMVGTLGRVLGRKPHLASP